MTQPITEPTIADLRRYRRDLHRIPEVDFDLPQTVAYVTAELEGVAAALVERGQRARVFSPCRSTVCLFLDRGSQHATAIRSDMDALPVTEQTGAPYASTHPGKMHACGHDGHMAMVLGLAWHLALHADELPRSVLLIFQPAEETTGGARVICQTEVFQELGVDRIFGFHLWPDLPAGQVASRAGALLAASNETTIEVAGRASHIAKASEGRDALLTACRIVDRLDAYGRQREAEEPCLVKFGHLQAGEVRNAIAAHARVEGSVRTFSRAMGERIQRELPQIVDEEAAREGCTATVEFSAGYPPVVNDEKLFAQVQQALPDLALVPEPLLISEDFSWYQQELPGVFLLLGTGTGIPLHAATFDFDEDVLMQGLKAYERLVRMP